VKIVEDASVIHPPPLYCSFVYGYREHPTAIIFVNNPGRFTYDLTRPNRSVPRFNRLAAKSPRASSSSPPPPIHLPTCTRDDIMPRTCSIRFRPFATCVAEYDAKQVAVVTAATNLAYGGRISLGATK